MLLRTLVGLLAGTVICGGTPLKQGDSDAVIIPASNVTSNLQLKIPAFPNVIEGKWEDAVASYLRKNFDEIYAPFKKAGMKVPASPEDAIKMAFEAAPYVFRPNSTSQNAETSPKPPPLHSRGLLDGFKAIGCSIFASGPGISLFGAASVYAASRNTAGSSVITRDQMFFAYPAYGDFPQTAGLAIHFDAGMPPFFGGRDGVTFNRKIYIGGPTGPAEDYENFWYGTAMLVHEIRHVLQYRDYDYVIPAFGMSYMYHWCYDGGYEDNMYEAQARASAETVHDLFYDGYVFFRVWHAKNLFGALGYPTKGQTHRVDANVRELELQRGLLQVNDRRCFRTFNQAELGKRQAAECDVLPPCPRWPRRDAAAQPAALDEEDPDPEDFPEPAHCKQAERDQKNKACRERHAEWAALEASRGFDCTNRVPA